MSPSPRRASCALARVLAPIVALALVACGDDGPSAPKPITLAPGVRVIGGMGVNDTIDTKPGPLVLELRDAQGQPRPGVAVHYEVPAQWRATVGVCPTMLLVRCATETAPIFFQDSGTVVSDAEGRVTMPVRLQQRADTAWVRVIATSIGLRDSVRYIVRPGRAVGLRVPVGPIAVYVGTGLGIYSYVSDRNGNVVSERVQLTGDEHVQVNANGTLTATSIGLAELTARGGGFTSRFTISVVPRGRVAVADSVGIFLLDLDGTGERLLASGLGPLRRPAWSHDGRSIYAENRFLLSPDSGLRTGIVAIDTLFTGAWTELTESDGRVLQGGSPSPSRDGQWLYFIRDTSAMRFERATRRVERISIPGITRVNALDISPDGQRLAIETAANGQPRVRVLDLTTGQLTGTDLPGWSPRWSPDGQRLAFVNLAELPSVAAPDGTGARVLFGAGVFPRFDHDVGWTADGAFVAALGVGGIVLARVEVEEQLRVPMNEFFRRDIAVLR